MKTKYIILLSVIIILVFSISFFLFKDSTILKSNLSNKEILSFSDNLISWNGNTLDIIEPYSSSSYSYSDNNSIPLTFTSSGSLDQCWYNIDGGTNYSTLQTIATDSDTLVSGLGYIHGTVYVQKYNAFFASTRTNPANIIKFNNTADISDYTSSTVEIYNADAIAYSSYKDKLYVIQSTATLSRTTIYEVDPNDLSSSQVINSLAYTAGGSPAMVIDGQYLYVLSYQSPSVIYKWDLDTYTLTDSETLGVNSENGHTMVLDGDYLYVSGAGGSNWVGKINKNDLTYTNTSISYNDRTSTDDSAVTENYYFIGSEVSGNITRINKSDLTSQTSVNFGITDSCYGIYYNSSISPYVYAVFNSNPGKMVRFNPDTLDYETYTTPNIYPNEIISDEQKLFITYWQNPSKVTLRNLWFNEWGDSCIVNTTFGTTNNALHTINLYANDTSNNLGVDTVQFAVNYDLVAPRVDYDSSTTSGTTGNDFIFVNVTSSDVGRGERNVSTFVDFDNSLVGWWTMDNVSSAGEGATVYDQVGGIDGTAYGNAIQTDAGKLGKGFEFDGSGDYIGIPDNNIFSFTDGSDNDKPYSVSSWIYMIDATSFAILGKYVNAGSLEWSLGLSSSDTLQIINFDESTDGYIYAYTSALTSYQNKWINVVATYNASTETRNDFEIYINGIKQSITRSNSGTYSGMENLNDIVRIGHRQTNYANGLIDDVMIFNRTLTADEIAGLYANSSTKYFDATFSGLSEGTYDFTAYAQDLNGNINLTSRSVTYTRPDFKIELLNPTLTNNNYNITQNEGLWVDLNITCIVGICGTINVSLDPIVYEDFTTWTESDPSNDLTVTQNSISSEQILGEEYYITKSIDFPENFTQRFKFKLNSYAQMGEYLELFWFNGDIGGIGMDTFVNGDNYYLWLYDYKNSEVQSKNNSVLLNFETEYYIKIIQTSNILYVYITTGSYNGELVDIISVSNSFGVDFTSEILGYGATEGGSDLNFTISNLEINPSLKLGLIPIESDWTNLSAFYTNATSNPLTTTSLSQGQSQTIRFWVNATGNIDTYNFYAYGNLTSNPSISNKTLNWEVTIIEQVYDTSFTVSLPIGYTQLNFSSNSKTVTNLEPEGQNSTNGIIYLTNTGEETLNIYFKINQLTDGFNIFFDIDNNPIGSKLLNSSNQLLKSSLTTSSSQNIWGWVNWTDKTPQTNSTQLNISVERN